MLARDEYRGMILGVTLALLGCSAWNTPGPAGQPPRPDEQRPESGDSLGQPADVFHLDVQTRIFAAAVQGIFTKDPREGTRVYADPRPVVIPEGPAILSRESYEPYDSAAVAARISILHQAGLEIGTVFPIRGGACTGAMVPPQYKDTSGCPDHVEIRYGFSRAEPVDGGGTWQLRMLQDFARPEGSFATTYAVTVVRRDGRFVFDRYIPLVDYN